MIIYNKGITRQYTILDRFEAGIVLLGHEVKSIRNKNVSFKGSFITIKNGVPIIMNLHIGKWKYCAMDTDKYRTRKLLLSHREITKLETKLKEKGLSIIPISIYTKGNRIKIEIALAKGIKEYDAKKKERDLDRLRMKEIREARLTKL